MIQKFLFFSFFIGCAITAFTQKVEWALVDTKTTKPFHDGIACFKEKVNGVELYGGIDRSGNVVIPPRYKGGAHGYDFEFDGGFAVVTDTNGLQGIINRQGVYILEPKYDYISKAKEANGLYTIKKGEKQGIFYNNRLVIPVEYDYAYTMYFPFVTAHNKGDKEIAFHLFTGEHFGMVSQSGNIISARQGNKWRYFEQNGDELDASALSSISSKGLMVFQDTVTIKYGLKKATTGEIVVAPSHKYLNKLWIYDVLSVTDYDNDGRPTEGLIDAAGREIIKRGKFSSIQLIDQNFVRVYYGSSILDSKCGLYTITGKELLPAEYEYVLELGNGLFSVKKGEAYSFYNANTGKMYSGYMVVSKHDGMCSFSFQKKKGYINVETGNILSAKYDYGYDFSEGVALVEKDGKKHLIDKSGRIVLSENNQFSFFSCNEMSEGVIGAYDEVNRTSGYIYNPVGKREYVYNQTAASDATIYRWLAEGDNEFEKRKYATAKEYYYKAMMCAPENVTAIINYGACLGNMGYYDEAIEACQMALDIEPGDEVAAKNLIIFQNNKKMQEEQAQQQIQEQETNYKTRRSSTFWDALGAFANALGNMYGSTTPTTNYEEGGTYSSQTTGNPSGGTSTGRGAAYYQTQYQNWERRAESNYRSLTNLGVSFRERNTGERTGSTLQSMNGANYVSMKKCLREAQREMQKYRRQAAREGITIPQSVWETATVSY